MVIASKTAMIATANRLAEPRSARTRFGRRDRLSCDGDARQERRPRGDPGDDELAIATYPHGRPVGCDALCGIGCRAIIAARREPSSLTCGVDAPHLHRHGGEPRRAQDEDGDEGSDRERRLDSDTTGRAGDPTPAILIG